MIHGQQTKLGRFGLASVRQASVATSVSETTIRRWCKSGVVRTAGRGPMQVDVGDVMFAATPSLVPKLAARVCELQAEVDSRKRERRVRHRAMDAARRGDWLRIAVRVLCAWERVGQEPSRHALECEIARYSLIGDTTMLGIWVAKFLDKAIDLH